MTRDREMLRRLVEATRGLWRSVPLGVSGDDVLPWIDGVHASARAACDGAEALLATPEPDIGKLVLEARTAVTPIRKEMEAMEQRAEDMGWRSPAEDRHFVSTGLGLVQYVERLADALEAATQEREEAMQVERERVLAAVEAEIARWDLPDEDHRSAMDDIRASLGANTDPVGAPCATRLGTGVVVLRCWQCSHSCSEHAAAGCERCGCTLTYAMAIRSIGGRWPTKGEKP